MKQEPNWREVAVALSDEDKCHYDHHGYCQTHSLHLKPCPHSIVQDYLRDALIEEGKGMNQPTVYNVTWSSGYRVNQPSWDGGEVVSLEEIATYIERDSEILLPIVPGETKHDYGLRMLKELAAEIRRFKR